MPDAGLHLLSAMITPAVLISASGTLIFSTAARLGRIMDRVRALTGVMERLFSGAEHDFLEERVRHVDVQLGLYAERSRLVQRSLTALYVAVGLFVGTTISIGITAFLPRLAFLPTVLGIAGTLELFRGCVLLIAETRLAVKSTSDEMEFTRRLGQLYQRRTDAPRPSS